MLNESIVAQVMGELIPREIYARKVGRYTVVELRCKTKLQFTQSAWWSHKYIILNTISLVRFMSSGRCGQSEPQICATLVNGNKQGSGGGYTERIRENRFEAKVGSELF